MNTYNTPVSRTSYVQDTAFFLQDKWAASRRFTFNIGLRVEKFRGWQPEVCQVQTQFVAGQCFGALEDAPNWLDPSPRIGVSTTCRATGARLSRSAPAATTSARPPATSTAESVSVTNDTRSWRDDNGDRIRR